MNIIVTGASRGIGYETVKHLVSLGNHTIMVLSRSIHRMEQLKSECQSINPASRVLPVEFDLANISSKSETLLRDIRNTLGSLDIVINNAGSLVNKPFCELSSEEMERMINVNFLSAAKLIAILSSLLNSKGHVVNIGSMGGFQGSSKFPGLAMYSATKAALACLTECLAEEFKENGPSFNCLALGAVDTEMLREAFPGYSPPTTAKQMGEFVANFALNGNKYFNGKVIPVSISTP